MSAIRLAVNNEEPRGLWKRVDGLAETAEVAKPVLDCRGGYPLGAGARPHALSAAFPDV